ncbi:MAG TPA: hypothetical protein VMZ28_25785 [Kofleriaceae bacterium]|nr:hypothetical protein [Kofleriaceae bacterium]
MAGFASVRRGVTAAVALVALLGLVAELLHHRDPPGVSEEVVELVSLSYEGNLPTWLSSSLLLACAVALVAIARAPGAQGAYRRHWALLGVLFGYLSIDESVELHERLNLLVDLDGPLYFGWIVPAAAVVAALGLVYLRFLLALPARLRRRFVVAGAIYVGGALLMEVPLGLWVEAHGDGGLGYALIDFAEELLEMIGASLFLFALLDHHAEVRAS